MLQPRVVGVTAYTGAPTIAGAGNGSAGAQEIVHNTSLV